MSTERWHYRVDLARQTGAPFGAGAFKPGNVLLIGEQASDPAAAPEQQPFCSSKGCSGWLNNKLEEEAIPEEKLFWVNALNNDHTPVNLTKLVVDLKPSVVIALGGIAQKQCKVQGVSFQPFYHPQYWKRFKSKHRYALLDKLRELTCQT